MDDRPFGTVEFIFLRNDGVTRLEVPVTSVRIDSAHECCESCIQDREYGFVPDLLDDSVCCCRCTR